MIGVFTEIGLAAGLAEEAAWSSSALFFDADGHLDLYVGNYVAWSLDDDLVCTIGRQVRSYCTPELYKEMVGVYRYGGGGLFVDRAAVSKIGQPTLLTLTFGLFLFDVDLDGDLDLFVANGHISEEIEQVEDGIRFRQPAQLFLNRGDGLFDAE